MQFRQTTTRADVVRQRRTDHPRNNKARTSYRRTPKGAIPAQPPILIRSGLTGVVTPERKRNKRVKRRYDVQLNTPGAEMRLPSLPHIALGWRLLSGLLMIGLVGLIYVAWTDPAFQVTTLRIRGLQRLDYQDIATVAGILGEPIYLVQPEKAEQTLEAAFPELVSVAVVVRIPVEVLVEIVERQPIIVWEQDGHTYWVDASGVAFPPRGDDDPEVKVEVVNWPEQSTGEGNPQAGEKAIQLLSADMVNAILRVDEEAPKKTHLVFDGEHGLGWEDSRGWEVFFGIDIKDIDTKLKVYETLVKSLKKEKIRPELISVEYVNAPYYRLER